MASKKSSTIPTEKPDGYKKLVHAVPNLKVKGATMPYTSHNGHMFSFLDKDGRLALRLPEDEREAFIKKYKTSLFEVHGAVLKEYVHVPDKLFKEIATLKKYFQKSFKYVVSLKPKPAKKK